MVTTETADHHVVATASGYDVVATRTGVAGSDLGEKGIGQERNPRCRVQIRSFGLNGVVNATGNEFDIAGVTHHQIGIGVESGMEGVGTVRTKDDVVTNAGVDEIIAAATHDEIITLAGADGER